MPEKEADSEAACYQRQGEGRVEMVQPGLNCRGSKQLGLLQMLPYHHVTDWKKNLR